MMKNSPFCPPAGYPEKESQLFRRHRGQLLRLIEHDPENFADDLLSVHVISEQVLSDIRKCRRGKHRFISYPDEQARKLLEVVKNVIQADPRKFGDFLEVVNKYSPSLAKELTYTCGQNFQLVVDDLEIKFTPEAQIGEGSFGDVWKGTRSGLPCAVKMLYGVRLLHSHEKQRRFESECKYLEQLEHPNIVRYLQTYVHPESGTPLLVIELMNENLSTFLERQRETSGKRLSECVQVKMCSDVAEALKYLHAKHIIHRDLSSDNILLLGSTQTVNCKSICAKVSDFGIARLVDSERFEKTLNTLKSGAYTPPESWKCPGKHDQKFDIFQFGVLMVQTITMLPPNPSHERIDSSGGIIPEVKRRQNHLKQIEGHPLEDLTHHCLQDKTTVRPTACEICQVLRQLTIECLC